MEEDDNYDENEEWDDPRDLDEDLFDTSDYDFGED